MKDWKTTSTGILMIVGAVVTLIFSSKNAVTIMACATAVIGGIGLLFAKDATPPTV